MTEEEPERRLARWAAPPGSANGNEAKTVTGKPRFSHDKSPASRRERGAEEKRAQGPTRESKGPAENRERNIQERPDSALQEREATSQGCCGQRRGGASQGLFLSIVFKCKVFCSTRNLWKERDQLHPFRKRNAGLSEVNSLAGGCTFGTTTKERGIDSRRPWRPWGSFPQVELVCTSSDEASCKAVQSHRYAAHVFST